MALVTSFFLALALSAAATPVVIWVARRRGWVVHPRNDRWHRRPTAVYGGVAIFFAFVLTFLLSGSHPVSHWVLVACAGAMFLVGLVDDAMDLKPQVKFLAQLMVAMVAVSLGVGLDREVIPWPWVSIPLAVLWLVGITNAVNILDNMDGLSSGVVLVAGVVLAVGSVLNHFPRVGPLAAALAGAAGGFLIYNFNPARIFMGDCGSLFLGFTLAGITILSTNTAAGASSVVMSLLIPLGVLIVPIFDTTLVTFQRASHGRSIAQGGRDHSSHRLVFLGLSERRAVMLLMAISLAGGVGAMLLVRYANPLVTLVIVAVLAVVLLFFGLYLGEVKVYDAESSRGRRWRSPVLDNLVLHKRQLLQIVVDMVMLAAAYLAAWLLRFEGQVGAQGEHLIAQSLPWLLAAKLASFWLFGLYRGQWRHISVHDYLQIFKGCLVGSLVTVLILVVFYRFAWYSRAVIILDFILAYLFVAGSRSLLRVFREKVRAKEGIPVLIMGAGDGGDLLLRELHNNPSLPYQPVGLIDDDPAKRGMVLHGVKVLGDRHDLEQLIPRLGVKRVFISILSAPEDGFEDVKAVCRRLGVECTRIQPIIKL